jgi:hypothetical protein
MKHYIEKFLHWLYRPKFLRWLEQDRDWPLIMIMICIIIVLFGFITAIAHSYPPLFFLR